VELHAARSKIDDADAMRVQLEAEREHVRELERQTEECVLCRDRGAANRERDEAIARAEKAEEDREEAMRQRDCMKDAWSEAQEELDSAGSEADELREKLDKALRELESAKAERDAARKAAWDATRTLRGTESAEDECKRLRGELDSLRALASPGDVLLKWARFIDRAGSFVREQTQAAGLILALHDATKSQEPPKRTRLELSMAAYLNTDGPLSEQLRAALNGRRVCHRRIAIDR
jgi:chromosome segregation ATPase